VAYTENSSPFTVAEPRQTHTDFPFTPIIRAPITIYLII